MDLLVMNLMKKKIARNRQQNASELIIQVSETRQNPNPQQLILKTIIRSNNFEKYLKNGILLVHQ